MGKIYRYRINNSELKFSDIIYISPKGNDILGNGTEKNPYITIKKALSMVTKDNTAIVLKEGEYNERLKDYGKNSQIKNCLFTTIDYSVTFLGEGNKTIINTEMTAANSYIVKAGTKNLAIYGITVNIGVDYAGDNASNYIFAGDVNDSSSVDIYNCVFKFLDSQNKTGLYYANYGIINAYNSIFIMANDINSFAGYRLNSAKLTMTNCIVRELANWNSFNSGSVTPYIDIENCIINNDKLWNANGTMTQRGNNIIFYTIFDNKYYPINTIDWKNGGKTDIKNPDNSISNIGVYGGNYRWSDYESTDTNITINKVNDTIEKGTDYDFYFKIDQTFVTNKLEINNAGIESFNDNQNITYLYNYDKIVWKCINSFEIL